MIRLANDEAKERVVSRIMRWRWRLAVVADAALWAVALTYATWARLEFDWSAVDRSGLEVAIAVAVAAQLVIGHLIGVYMGRWQATSFEGVGWFGLTSLLTALVLMGFVIATPGSNVVPRSAVGAGAAIQLVSALCVRYVARLLLQSYYRSDHEREHRLIVYGAGEAGREIVRALQEDPFSNLMPAAFVDDDPSKSRMRIRGVPVAGTRIDIASVAERYEASVLLLAIPSADLDTVAEVAEIGVDAGLEVRVLPRVGKYLTDPVRATDIREIRLSDFLSREEVLLDIDEIKGYLEGKRVLVTGAAGSVGSQLCKTIKEFSPEQLIMLDISENGLHALALDLDGRARLDAPELVLGDVCDYEGLRRTFEEFKPHVVFHAAARKHVAFLERHPETAIQTNVFGTLNVLRAASEHGVERLVNISTDKAADPINALGMTKRVGEMLTAHFGNRNGEGFMSVRFGNVLGSAGSVVETFRHQLAEGLPLTITDPEVTRYFMTIEEAIRLVVQAGAYGGDGDVLVLDMGEPVKIVDLARQLAAEVTPGRAPKFEITGLGPGEKLHETLIASDDDTVDHPHERLQRVRVPVVDPEEIGFRGSVPNSELQYSTIRALVGNRQEPRGADTVSASGATDAGRATAP